LQRVMSRTLLTLVGVVALSAVANGQCAAVDHPNCANWVKNGFCTNPGYSISYLQTYCPKSCANSGCGPAAAVTTTTAATAAFTENKNCPKWAESPTTMFCASTTITLEQKKTICKETCKAEANQEDGCAIYTQTADKVKKEANVATGAAKLNAATADGATKVVAVYVKDKCEVELFADDAAPAGTKLGLGTPTVNNYKVEPAQQTSQKYTCTCNP
ncbi:hypothetical protein PFISCL1PPCAC_28205, partial [Pristionchus fissidentatus]